MRLRPGSKGEPFSKVATTGTEVARQAAEVRVGKPPDADPLAENYTVALMGGLPPKGLQQEAVVEAIPFHQPDDAGVLRRLFQLDVPDI